MLPAGEFDMAHFAADLHIHSRFSKRCSQEMSIPNLVAWAPRKGVDLLGSGGFLNASWRGELEERLEPDGSGLFKPKAGGRLRLMLADDLEVVVRQAGREASLHLLVTAPDLEAADRLTRSLDPIAESSGDAAARFHVSAGELVERILSVSPESLVILTSLWSPRYSTTGLTQPFLSFAATFGSYGDEVCAVETGLSSDPAMCWRVGELDGKSLLSSSDACSLKELGREMTLFQAELSYEGVANALKGVPAGSIQGTLELVSELGQYFFNGHRDCQIARSPIETCFEGRWCPACRRELTIGAFQRMLESASRTTEDLDIIEERGWIWSRRYHFPPFRRTIPLDQITEATYGLPRAGDPRARQSISNSIVFGEVSEREVLLDLDESALQALVGYEVAEAILRVRDGFFKISPGYDGVPGQLEIFGEGECVELQQMRLF